MKKVSKWRTVVALALMYTAIFMSWEWIWGILFLYWVIPDIFSGVTYFIEPIFKRENPTLYWVIIITWIVLAFYSLSVLLIDYNSYYF
ncbi:hypothetical protein AAON49_06090 [Pseudotenacibaculum sp. MALMAid0570]|uniref:hypothetical protein n=1 Tax=Pseudotenacibaculum sp. MALMAid0570 TaxID=3143938 RepID=UPI0032E011B6